MSAAMKTDRAYETEVESNWSETLIEDPSRDAFKVDQIEDREVFLVDQLFSPQECEKLVERAEEVGFGKTNYPKSYRGNLRLITKDQAFTDAVWQRLGPLVPATVTMPSGKRGDDAVWDACGLNECWRLAKYYPGDVFKGHCDAPFSRKYDVEESMFTVNIYMNGGFEGGTTRFYFEGDSKPPGQNYYHDGERLGSGIKYLFRTDVMYRKRQATNGQASPAGFAPHDQCM